MLPADVTLALALALALADVALAQVVLDAEASADTSALVPPMTVDDAASDVEVVQPTELDALMEEVGASASHTHATTQSGLILQNGFGRFRVPVAPFFLFIFLFVEGRVSVASGLS